MLMIRLSVTNRFLDVRDEIESNLLDTNTCIRTNGRAPYAKNVDYG
jgi:hypothetical protein